MQSINDLTLKIGLENSTKFPIYFPKTIDNYEKKQKL